MDHTNAKPIVAFRFAGRFAHFLRAEASASALSYPLPPRTVLLGVMGAVLGLTKDTPQTELDDALIAVSGKLPATHWHRAKFRKEPPAALPTSIKVSMKGSDKPEKATLIKQEWLIEPDYQIMVSLPEKHHATFVQRLKDRAWYFAPCLGLSEMNADLTFIAEGTARPLLEEQTIQSMTVTPQQSVEIDGKQLLETSLEPLNLQVIRMPRDLSSKRVFSHANYLVERQGRAIPVITSQAWQLSGEGLEGKQVLFL